MFDERDPRGEKSTRILPRPSKPASPAREPAREAPSPLARLAVKGNGLLFDSATGQSYRANETAVAMVELMQAGLGENGIVDAMVARYGVAESVCRRDIADLSALLGRFGLKGVER